MKTLYLECHMGAAGDMLTAALLELHPDPMGFLRRVNALGLEGVHISAEKSVKCGITGTHISVSVHGIEEESHDVHTHDHSHDHEHSHNHGHDHDHEHTHSQEHEHEHIHSHGHHHSSLSDIAHIVSYLELSQSVKEDVLAVYELIAQAESKAHGKPVEEIHFHEVGTMDAVADITAVCLLIHELKPDRIVASPVHVGSGHVHCAHGILPVPAPATAHILRGVPTYGGTIEGELCTPTGAALLKHYVTSFGAQPVMQVERIGYGMGKKDFTMANCLRAYWGETEEQTDQVVQLSCNVDDMTGEEMGFAMEQLFAGGALEVFTTPCGMKKNRPGILLTVLCPLDQREKMVRLMFRHTTTIGIRETLCNRYTLTRKEDVISGECGSVQIKTSSGWGVVREKAEYDDLARIAREQGISLREAREQVNPR